MPKWLRYTIRTAAGLLGLLLLIWLLLAGYILMNKASLLKKAQTEIKNRLGGDATVGDWDISLFRHFPSVTLHLSQLALRDSGWQQHHHDLIHTDNADISLSLFRSLLARKIRVGKVYLEHGTVYFYTDTAGYSNTYLLRSRSEPVANREPAAEPPDIILKDINWVQERQDKHKLFDLDIQQMSCTIRKDSKDDRTLFLGVDATIRVKSFSFNTSKGSFIKDKSLSGHFIVQYNTGSKIVQANKITVDIDGHPFLFTARFFPSVNPDPFFLTIATDNIRFRDAASLLTPNLQQHLDQYDIDKPVSIHALIDAGSADDRTPLLNIKMDLDKGNVLTPAGRFNNSSFRASFTNEWTHGQRREDENSGIRLLSFSGQVLSTSGAIAIRSDTLTVTNLKHPILDGDLHSQFDLARLNDLLGSQSLQFQKGSCAVDLLYRGPLSENDSTANSVQGTVALDSAAFMYLPYQFLLTNGNGRVLLKGKDLVIDHLDARVGNTRISVKGIAKNLVTLLDQNAQDVSMDWDLSSSHLDLRDFTSLAGRQTETTPKRNSQAVFGAVAGRIDRFLKEGAIHLRLEAADLSYKNFTGAHARADLLFSSDELQLTNMEVEQGGGSLRLKADLHRQRDGSGNPIILESHIQQVNLPKLFTSFNDFGQKALLSKNLKGSLTADIRMTGLLTNKATMVPNSLKGTVNFSIKEGQLLDFEPMEKIHETVLKKRDLSEIHFSDLTNRLDLDTTTLTIHRMEISSTALTVFVEGVYDFRTGPDLSIQVPLSNLKQKNPDIPPANKGNDGKTGLSVRLRARTGDDGKLKISWDPFKKALKGKPPTSPSRGHH